MGQREKGERRGEKERIEGANVPQAGSAVSILNHQQRQRWYSYLFGRCALTRLFLFVFIWDSTRFLSISSRRVFSISHSLASTQALLFLSSLFSASLLFSPEYEFVKESVFYTSVYVYKCTTLKHSCLYLQLECHKMRFKERKRNFISRFLSCASIVDRIRSRWWKQEVMEQKKSGIRMRKDSYSRKFVEDAAMLATFRFVLYV